jgi:hypothetical protein
MLTSRTACTAESSILRALAWSSPTIFLIFLAIQFLCSHVHSFLPLLPLHPSHDTTQRASYSYRARHNSHTSPISMPWASHLKSLAAPSLNLTARLQCSSHYMLHAWPSELPRSSCHAPRPPTCPVRSLAAWCAIKDDVICGVTVVVVYSDVITPRGWGRRCRLAAGADRGCADENDSGGRVHAHDVGMGAERDARALAGVAPADGGRTPRVDGTHGNGPVLVGVSEQQLGVIGMRGRRGCWHPTRVYIKGAV